MKNCTCDQMWINVFAHPIPAGSTKNQFYPNLHLATNHPELAPNVNSKGISLDPLETHGLTIKTTIHYTDTVTVIVACSLNPVAVDIKGLVRLSNALTRVGLDDSALEKGVQIKLVSNNTSPSANAGLSNHKPS